MGPVRYRRGISRRVPAHTKTPTASGVLSPEMGRAAGTLIPRCPMLADLLPHMTDTVRHWHEPARDLYGRSTIVPATEEWWGSGLSLIPGKGTVTEHRARVTYSPGKALGRASREAMPDANATVWLIDHPHPIAIGDTFELPDAAALKVARLERRKLPGGVLDKVYLT